MLKPGVRLNGIKPETLVGMMEAREVWRAHGAEGVLFVVTSVADGVHTHASEHYCGNAFDLRKIAVPAQMARAVRALKIALGADFDVLHEGVGTVNEHVHVEYQPKESY